MAYRRGLAVRVACLLVAAGLAGCAGEGLEGLDASLGLSPAIETGSVRPEGLDEGQTQFQGGNYGKAVTAFKQAVEVDPLNAEAWLGLAASYDHTRRFDVADNAYRRVISLVGETPTVLNNIGYSHYLRGDLETAREKYQRAYKLSPDNPYVLNNIEILNRKLVSVGARPMVPKG